MKTCPYCGSGRLEVLIYPEYNGDDMGCFKCLRTWNSKTKRIE